MSAAVGMTELRIHVGDNVGDVSGIFIQPEDAWGALVMAGGKRSRSLVLGMGTPGVEHNNALYGIRTTIAEGGVIPRFYFREFSADAGCRVDDRDQWRAANPAIGTGFLRESALETDLRLMPEARFRIFRLGQWVDGYESWLGQDGRLIWDGLRRDLTANPIQALEQRTGRHAITLLVLSLACTPLNTLFGWRELIKRRRALGLYAFLYATLHVIIFVDLDYGLAWSLIIRTILEKPYIVVGVISFLMLIPLAFTSFDIWKKRLGRNWKRLHQLIYLIAPLVALHYAWGKKGDFFRLQGEIVRPLIYAAIILLLLIMRIPQVRKTLASVRDRIIVLFRRREPAVE